MRYLINEDSQYYYLDEFPLETKYLTVIDLQEHTIHGKINGEIQKRLVEPRLSLIVAQSNNNVIGKNNKLPWHFSTDLKYFKEITSHSVIIMGKNTYNSINKELPNRQSIVVTTDEDFNSDYALKAFNLTYAIELAKTLSNKEIFIIGGDSLYKQSLHLVNKLYITTILKSYKGNAYFPNINYKNWELIASKKDIENNIKLVFEVYQRKQ